MSSNRSTWTTRRRILVNASAGAVALAVGAATSHGGTASAQDIQPSQSLLGRPLIGSWLCTHNRSTGEVLTGLLTFHENGTVINSTSDHLTGSTSHGTWSDLGGSQYAYSVMRLNVAPDGSYAGMRSVDADVTVDSSGNSWTSVSRTIFYDPLGALVRTLTSSGTASRIAVVRRTDPRPENLNSL